ncbi:unannotated protein [freshwater metagenome]|uniref:Unannotated protein n=1 Tax=freshwater metagenome TaxID=449393 RepID=A0A6J6HH03_9ZZZZ|nr:RDD family protein [Actinomycetota bacterium]
MTESTNWAGKRLGLPETGSGSLAKMGRRVLALGIDWALALMVSRAFFDSDNTATLTFFMLEQWLLVATLGNSFGHLIAGIKVRKLDGSYVGIVPALIRIGLILLVIPAVIWDTDNRGLHDKAAKTVLVRR